MTISDYFRDNGHGFMNADAALTNGVNAMLSTYDSGPNVPQDTSDASIVQYMREASRYILYTVVNSWAYEDGEVDSSIETWTLVAIGIDAAIGVLLAGSEVLLVRRYLRARRTA